MFNLSSLSLYGLVLIFVASAGAITLAGTRLTRAAEDIAYQTGWGQAVVGAVFVGISTSLSGTTLSFYAAAQSYPSLAIANSIGGIAAQTAFLSIADLTYRKINLEHAAASLENLAQAALLIILLSIPLLAMAGPEWTFFKIHPASLIMITAYLTGLKVVEATKSNPMWQPRRTYETQIEKKKKRPNQRRLKTQFISFALLGLILCGSGIVLAEAAVELSQRTGLSESVVGGLFTSVTTSLPELVTTLAAVRRGALNLAVGNIIGGNSFDVLFLAGSDIFYSDGSIYHQIQGNHIMLISMAMLMTGVLVLGMLRREKSGPAGIGFESMIVLGLYGLIALMMLG